MKGNVKAKVSVIGNAKDKLVLMTGGTGKSNVNPNLERRPGGSFKTTSTEAGSNSGSTNGDLTSAASRLYKKALQPVQIDGMGDTSMHTR